MAAVVSYLRSRGLAWELCSTVEAVLDAASSRYGGRRSISSLNRQLARWGDLRSADWRALIDLMPLLEQEGPSVEELAWSNGFDPRTLRSRTRLLLGVGMRVAIGRPGWEWKLETVLRRHHYANSEPSNGDTVERPVVTSSVPP